MKRYIILILISISIPFSIKLHAQKLQNSHIINNIDTINIFPAIGFINSLNERIKTPNDSLTNLFKLNFPELLKKSTIYKINYLNDNYELNDSLKKYFINTIPKFGYIDNETFSIIPIGDSFNKMISQIPGRYFGIIFYEGYLNNNMGSQLAKSIAIATTTAILTGGTFSVYPIPQEPYLISDFLLIDKTENKFLFYCRKAVNGSPLNEEKVIKLYQKIFNSYK